MLAYIIFFFFFFFFKFHKTQLRKGKRGQDARAELASTGSGSTVVRPKVIKLDSAGMKDFITGFHQRKNQRRIFAIKKAKDEHRKTVNAERRQRREERRQTYNNMTQFPITEDYKLAIPGKDSDNESDDNDVDMEEEGQVETTTYNGTQNDTVVDVEVEGLDLGTNSHTVRARAPSSEDSSEDEAEKSTAFPSAAPTGRYRLVRKRK